MKKARRSCILLALAFLAAAGCSDSVPAGDTDGAVDSGRDTGHHGDAGPGDDTGGGGGDANPDGGSMDVYLPPEIVVGISPSQATVQANLGSRQFIATVQYAQKDQSVRWSILGDPGDGSYGNIDKNGLYKAPADVPAGNFVTVVVTSVEDDTKSATAPVRITPPVSIAVVPKTARVEVLKNFPFGVTLQYATTLKIKWEIVGTGDLGTITENGVYTAPATPPAADVTIRATSEADPSKSDTATINVHDPIAVTVKPASAYVNIGRAKPFTAEVLNSSMGVKWTIAGGPEYGTIDENTGVYTAPQTIPAQCVFSIIATSVEDSSRKGNSNVAIIGPVLVDVKPDDTTVPIGGSVQFNVTVGNAELTGATWELEGEGTIDQTGLYLAPDYVPSPDTVKIKATSVDDPARFDVSIVRIVPVVTVFAGNKNYGFKKGNGVAAQLAAPGGIAIDGALNVAVADSGNHKIRRFDSGATELPTAGDAAFCGVGGFDISQVWCFLDSSCYANEYDCPLRSMLSPFGIAMLPDGNTMYVAESGYNLISRVRQASPDWQARSVVGCGDWSYEEGTLNMAYFAGPKGVGWGKSAAGVEFLYVPDFGNNMIRTVDLSTFTTASLAGAEAGGYKDGKGSIARFSNPLGIVVRYNNKTEYKAAALYVSDFNNHQIRKVTPDGTVTTIAGARDGSGLPISGSGDGKCMSEAGFNNPAGLSLDDAGNLYVADQMNHVIRKIVSPDDPAACAVKTFAGKTGSYGSNDDPPNKCDVCPSDAALFNSPAGVAASPDGSRVFVIDQKNNRVRLIKSSL